MRAAAAAGGLRVRVRDFESGRVEPFDIVDFAAHQTRFFLEQDMDLDAVRMEDEVISGRFFREVEEVFKTAAAGHLLVETKGPALFALFAGDFEELFSGSFGNGDARRVDRQREKLVQLFNQVLDLLFGLAVRFHPLLERFVIGRAAADAMKPRVRDLLGQLLRFAGKLAEDLLNGHLTVNSF